MERRGAREWEPVIARLRISRALEDFNRRWRGRELFALPTKLDCRVVNHFLNRREALRVIKSAMKLYKTLGLGLSAV